MNVTINGEASTVPDGTTVGDIVRRFTDARRGVAAAVNDEVVPKGGWDAAPVTDNDRIDVLTAVQGG